jgi:phosphoenolpyruvate carboxykinase (GTP)
VPGASLKELLSVDVTKWKSEIESIKEHYARFGDKLPRELTNQFSAPKKRLSNFQ